MKALTRWSLKLLIILASITSYSQTFVIQGDSEVGIAPGGKLRIEGFEIGCGRPETGNRNLRLGSSNKIGSKTVYCLLPGKCALAIADGIWHTLWIGNYRADSEGMFGKSGGESRIKELQEIGVCEQ